ncbi:hypothetical protein HU200_055313 [Digitaria exilis]|uniref:Uncharacterized protein n=1 Tax=Digitaria exilis TaxID=1010633 RepID=A0A835AKY0_9POAL|nr:hypothetical protein HU200_055313 [Digitaria exilis]
MAHLPLLSARPSSRPNPWLTPLSILAVHSNPTAEPCAGAPPSRLPAPWLATRAPPFDEDITSTDIHEASPLDIQTIEGVEDQRGSAKLHGGPLQLEFESISESRSCLRPTAPLLCCVPPLAHPPLPRSQVQEKAAKARARDPAEKAVADARMEDRVRRVEAAKHDAMRRNAAAKERASAADHHPTPLGVGPAAEGPGGVHVLSRSAAATDAPLLIVVPARRRGLQLLLGSPGTTGSPAGEGDGRATRAAPVLPPPSPPSSTHHTLPPPEQGMGSPRPYEEGGGGGLFFARAGMTDDRSAAANGLHHRRPSLARSGRLGFGLRVLVKAGEGGRPERAPMMAAVPYPAFQGSADMHLVPVCSRQQHGAYRDLVAMKACRRGKGDRAQWLVVVLLQLLTVQEKAAKARARDPAEKATADARMEDRVRRVEAAKHDAMRRNAAAKERASAADHQPTLLGVGPGAEGPGGIHVLGRSAAVTDAPLPDSGVPPVGAETGVAARPAAAAGIAGNDGVVPPARGTAGGRRPPPRATRATPVLPPPSPPSSTQHTLPPPEQGMGSPRPYEEGGTCGHDGRSVGGGQSGSEVALRGCGDGLHHRRPSLARSGRLGFGLRVLVKASVGGRPERAPTMAAVPYPAFQGSGDMHLVPVCSRQQHGAYRDLVAMKAYRRGKGDRAQWLVVVLLQLLTVQEKAAKARARDPAEKAVADARMEDRVRRVEAAKHDAMRRNAAAKERASAADHHPTPLGVGPATEGPGGVHVLSRSAAATDAPLLIVVYRLPAAAAGIAGNDGVVPPARGTAGVLAAAYGILG